MKEHCRVIKCPRCGFPLATFYGSNCTFEGIIICELCGYTKSAWLKKEFWDLNIEEMYKTDLSDDQWWLREEKITKTGNIIVNFKDGNLHRKETLFHKDLERFIKIFQFEFQRPDSSIREGDNKLCQFIEKDSLFRVTDLETLTTIDYLPEDFFEKYQRWIMGVLYSPHWEKGLIEVVPDRFGNDV